MNSFLQLKIALIVIGLIGSQAQASSVVDSCRNVFGGFNSRTTPGANDDARVIIDHRALEEGDHKQTLNAVTVFHLGSDHPTRYNRTNRGLKDLRFFYSNRMIDLSQLQGKVVVDMATGGGLFVKELRENGISAFGLDIALTKKQIANKYQPSNTEGTFELNANKPGIFILADAKNTRIADQQVDIIYDTYGLTEYEFFRNADFLRSVYIEWHRTLKVGGVIRFAPMDVSFVESVRQFISTIPGLELTSVEPTELEPGYSRSFEITRVR